MIRELSDYATTNQESFSQLKRYNRFYMGTGGGAFAMMLKEAGFSSKCVDVEFFRCVFFLMRAGLLRKHKKPNCRSG
jgi:hypothetical protein